MKRSSQTADSLKRFFRKLWSGCLAFLNTPVYFGRHVTDLPAYSIVFFPCRKTFFCCGLAGIVAFKKNTAAVVGQVDLEQLKNMVRKMEVCRIADCTESKAAFDTHYLAGITPIETLFESVRNLKNNTPFYEILTQTEIQTQLAELADRISGIIAGEDALLSESMGHLDTSAVDIIFSRLEKLKDIVWCLNEEISRNIVKVKDFVRHCKQDLSAAAVAIYKQINTVLNSMDRLEVRGRDSAGVSLFFLLSGPDFAMFKETLKHEDLLSQLETRSSRNVLLNRDIQIHETTNETENAQVAVTVTYKTAAEIGRLGDNVQFLREQIKTDVILQTLIALPNLYHSISAHTRWASVGAINEANCHPVDNRTVGGTSAKSGIIHACLNGDIDNYLELKKTLEKKGYKIPSDITTDTKVIPLQIDTYLQQNLDVEQAFRRAVNDFEGSHAIAMHTDLAPGKLFLAQRGSGQAIFIGLGKDHYMPTSEVYGFIEETPYYLKMDGEKIADGRNGKTQGQVFVLSQDSAGGINGIKAMYYDGTPVLLEPQNIKHTEITSRDIDRQNFAHYFLKEISESPLSVAKTLQNRWKYKDNDASQFVVALDEKVLPQSLQKALLKNRIKRIFFVGQGTAGVAASACADILNHYMDDKSLQISALKASELSGFRLDESDEPDSMADTLVIAVSQSGTTTDTNRTIDMVKERGAPTLAIVNRRDSDITFKVDGVLYTSTGRDIEMSVASTKAFYSQIVAGALLSLYLARLKGRRDDAFVTAELKQLLDIPDHMRKILAMQEKIERSAKNLAPASTYWAVVGSGPNKASADEIRIKLSELCYKTISSDYVEDKKHIDLSSEPLIIICAAGARSTVIGDIIKDTAIFRAHKATPVVIADEGETRFELYAADVFYVPAVGQHLAPIVNTLVGHLWGYYAALAINEGSRFLHQFRQDIQQSLDNHTKDGMDVYEVLLEKSFREKFAMFYTEFRRKKNQNDFPVAMGLKAASDLTLLLKYFAGRLPVSDFEIDFSIKGTALNMLNKLFQVVGDSINYMARPVDAIKHQAKTVTVGTSRISERLEGILFEALATHRLKTAQLTPSNIFVLKNLQGVVARVEGSILYRIGGLNLLGEPTKDTTIEILQKEGVLKPLTSRVETDNRLKGTKRIIVQQGNVYIGKGRKDDRSIIVIPVISASSDNPNMIEHLLLLNISFQENVVLSVKIKALGGKYEHIKNIVQENSISWNDAYIELVEISELFGRSAEKIGEYIVSKVNSAVEVH